MYLFVHCGGGIRPFVGISIPNGIAQAITLRKRTSNRNARDKSGKVHPFESEMVNPERWNKYWLASKKTTIWLRRLN